MWSNRVSSCGMITPGCLLALCVKAKFWLSQKWSSACNSLICAKWWLLMYYIFIFSSDIDLMGDILDVTFSSNKCMVNSTHAMRWNCTGISHPLPQVAIGLEISVFADPLTPWGEETNSFPSLCPRGWLFYRLHRQEAVWQQSHCCCICLKADGLHSSFPSTHLNPMCSWAPPSA